MTELGYGMRYDNASWKKTANKDFFHSRAKKVQWIADMYRDYCEAYALSPEGGFEDEFVDDYENDTFLWNGLTGMVTDVINDAEFGGITVFRDGDHCIYVAAGIPVDDEMKLRMPTQKDIRRILCEYVNPLLEEPAMVMWHEVRD